MGRVEYPARFRTKKPTEYDKIEDEISKLDSNEESYMKIIAKMNKQQIEKIKSIEHTLRVIYIILLIWFIFWIIQIFMTTLLSV